MKKKVLSFCLALAFGLGLLPTLSLPARAVGEESFDYTAPDGVIYHYGGDFLNSGDKVYRTYFLAIGYEGEPTDITIPFAIEGTYINENGEEVEFVKRVDGIKYGAFHNCDSLETVTIQGCPNLDGGFYQCASLRELDLSECTATTIDRSTFAYECPSLETVTLPAGLTRINCTAFGQCKNLRDVYFLGSTAPAVTPSPSTLHTSFNNAAIFHVPEDASGYGWTSSDNYRHAVVYGGKDDVPYGVDFTTRGWAPGGVDGTIFDLGTYWTQNHFNSSTRGEATYTVTNTASDTLTFKVTADSGNSGKVFCSAPYDTSQYGKLYPGETIESVPINLNGNAFEEPGTFEETFTLTGTGSTSGETHSETITVRYTVKDRKTAFELSETEVDFGDIPAGLSLDEMPTVTVTATNHLSQKGYVHLWYTLPSSTNPYYVEFLEGDNKTAISNGESITFRVRLTPYGLEHYLRDGKLDIDVSLRDSTSGSATVLGSGNITLKANPIHSSGLSLSSSALDLGKTESASYSANRFLNTSVTLTNTGTQDVVLTPSSLSNFSIAGVFSMTGRYTLEAGKSITVTVMPKDGLKPGVYEETVTISGGETKVTLQLKFTVGGGKETMEVSSSYLDFGRLTEGYEQPTAQTVTVENTGTETITLVQPTAWNYEVGRLSRTTLAAGETATFTLRPKAGLKAGGTGAGNYNETLTLRTSKGLSEDLELSFTVELVGAPGTVPSTWATHFVDQAIELGILPRELQSAYDQATTRQEFCLLADNLYLVLMGHYPNTGDPVTFTDTSDKYVLDMARAKVVSGVGGGRFEPDRSLEREEAATLLTQFALAVNKPLALYNATFSDNGEISDWALPFVGSMQNCGVMKGVGGNRFDPHGAYTREQSVVTIMLMYELLK